MSGPSAAAGGPSAAGGPGAGAGAGAAGQGALTAEGTSLLPVAQVAGPNGELTSQVGRTATAEGVLVQSVPADEGFWAGTSETDRVWVQLSGTGESGYVVQQGDRVDFTGQVEANDPGFAAQTGVEPTEGADQLEPAGRPHRGGQARAAAQRRITSQWRAWQRAPTPLAAGRGETQRLPAG